MDRSWSSEYQGTSFFEIEIKMSDLCALTKLGMRHRLWIVNFTKIRPKFGQISILSMRLVLFDRWTYITYNIRITELKL